MKSPKRTTLELPEAYIHALEDVLGIELGDAKVRERTVKQTLERLAMGVSEISEGLTRNRADFIKSRYLKDNDLRRAYLAYYTTTNILKIWPPLRELAAGGFFDGETSLRVLDLGSGTGAAAWGLATWLAEEGELASRPAISIVLTDLLRENLRDAEQLWRRLQKHLPSSLPMTAQFQQFDMRHAPEGPVFETEPYDLITMMNVMNEVDESEDERLIRVLKSLLSASGALIMIEPSSREESRRALRFRDKLVDAGYTIYAPCTCDGHCPALQKEDDWCHTEIPWERPEFIRVMDDKIGTLRLSLKSTYIIATPLNQNLSDHSFSTLHRDFVHVGRVVSENFAEKGRTRMVICNELGKREYVMNTRDETKHNQEFTVAERYDLVRIDGVEERPHDMKVGQDGAVNIVWEATGARFCG